MHMSADEQHTDAHIETNVEDKLEEESHDSSETIVDFVPTAIPGTDDLLFTKPYSIPSGYVEVHGHKPGAGYVVDEVGNWIPSAGDSLVAVAKDALRQHSSKAKELTEHLSTQKAETANIVDSLK